jgi:ribosome-binding ATPase YchF (GTP1/OBG family)
LEQEVKAKGLSLFVFRGEIETEIAQLPEAEQREFLEDLGLTESARIRFLKQLYNTLNLISFLTAGEDEVRAWSIPRGLNAMKAAGKIHTDLEKGFIRAEVIEWQDLLASGGFKEAKAQGKLRLEGKEYIVKDGDVLTIRFNL